MWRSLFSPKWLVVHVSVMSLVALMLFLSSWQFDRLQSKKNFNADVTERVARPVEPLLTVLKQDSATANLEWRRIGVSGRYDPSNAITVINRSQNGAAGYDSVIPLTLDNGTQILVNRGFVPLAMPLPDVPSGRVTVVGYLRASQSRTGLGLKDDDSRNTTEFQRFDIPRIALQLESPVQPMFLQLIQQDPANASEWPDPVPLPPLDEGTHMSYAIQWIFFSLVALTAWGIVIRRKLREAPRSGAAPEQTSA